MSGVSRQAAIAAIAAAGLVAAGGRARAQAVPAADADEAPARSVGAGETPAQAYARLYIGFDDERYAIVSVQGGPAYAVGTVVEGVAHVPYRGVDHEPLGPEAFYAAVDRPDLASAAATRHDVRIAGAVVGLAATVGSFILYGASVSALAPDRVPDRCDVTQPDFSQCENGVNAAQAAADQAASDRATSYLLAGTGAIVVGLVGAALYRYLDENPVDDAERHRLAREHDARLRRELGVPDGAPRRAPAPHDDDDDPPVQVTPYASAGGGGIALTGRF